MVGHDAVDVLADDPLPGGDFVVRVDVDDVMPGRADRGERAPHVLEGLDDLLLQRVRDVQVVVHTCLAGNLDPVPDADGAAVAQGIVKLLAKARNDAESDCVHGAPSPSLQGRTLP
ncbi:protein of unknown function [Streptomyces sp. KY75]|nr:protein of unknown function [Streptomyces sp. KY70]CAD5994251.1 protein of unknown function [Streptomyces sp. KY75]